MSLKRFARAIPRNWNHRFMSSGSPLVDVNVNDATGIAIVTMQSPPANTLTTELMQALSDTLDYLTSNKSRGMILTSALPNIFSAGLDVIGVLKPKEEYLRLYWTSWQDLWLKLYGSTFPTAAAINGHSPAGGCVMATSCEYRVMVQGRYTIGLNETALGIVAPPWFQNILRNTIAPRVAELAITRGTLFPVEEALKIGLIDEIATDKEDTIARCEKFFEGFAKINPTSRMFSKLVFREKVLKEFEETREEDVNRFVTLVTNPKTQKWLEGYMQALKNKKQ